MAIDAEELRLRVVEHLESLGMALNSEGEIIIPEMTKDFVRRLHAPATIRTQELDLF